MRYHDGSCLRHLWRSGLLSGQILAPFASVTVHFCPRRCCNTGEGNIGFSLYQVANCRLASSNFVLFRGSFWDQSHKPRKRSFALLRNRLQIVVHMRVCMLLKTFVQGSTRPQFGRSCSWDFAELGASFVAEGFFRSTYGGGTLALSEFWSVATKYVFVKQPLWIILNYACAREARSMGVLHVVQHSSKRLA